MQRSTAACGTGGAGRSEKPGENVGERYFRAVVQSGIGGILSRIFQGVAPVVLARCLGPREYGGYTLILSLVGAATIIANLGQNAALQRFLPSYAIHDRDRGGAILADTVLLNAGAVVLISLLFLVASPWFALALYHDASLVGPLRFGALLIGAMSLFNLLSSTVNGLQDFKTYGRALIIRSATFLAFGWVGAWWFGLLGALTGHLMGSTIGLAFLTRRGWTAARKRFPDAIRPVFSRDVLRELFAFAFPAFLAGLLVIPAYWWANTLLARHASLEEVGVFGVAFVLAQLIMIVPLNLATPAMSFMSETHALPERSRFLDVVGANLRLMWAITLPISFACALFAPTIIRVLFGSHYQAAETPALIMSFVALIMTLCQMLGYAIAATGQMWHAFFINLFWLAAFVPLCLVLVPRGASGGLAMAFLCSYALFATGFWLYIRAVLKISSERIAALLLLTIAYACAALLLRASFAGVRLLVVGCMVVGLLLVAEWYLGLHRWERRKLAQFIWTLATRLGSGRTGGRSSRAIQT